MADSPAGPPDSEAPTLNGPPDSEVQGTYRHRLIRTRRKFRKFLQIPGSTSNLPLIPKNKPWTTSLVPLHSVQPRLFDPT